MSVNAEVARIRTARDALREKMLAAGYEVGDDDTIDVLVDALELSKPDNFNLLEVNYTDRFITSNGKYMVNAASGWRCAFYKYTVNRGKTYRLTLDASYAYTNLLMADTLPVYNETGLPVQDFVSGAEITVNTKYLLVSITRTSATAVPASALTVTEL